VRKTTVGGTDAVGNALTVNTNVNVYGFRPDIRVGDILDTTGPALCYKYNY
jgi:tyrosinase